MRRPKRRKYKPHKSHSDAPVVIFAISFWAIIIFAIIFGVLKTGEFIFVKTSDAIVSYNEGAPAREEARKKNVVKYNAKKIEESKEKEAKDAKKKADRLAKLQESPSWDDEFGDLMYNADGTLKDPNPDDGYNAVQSYWILIITLIGAFCVWAGIFTKTPIGMLIACIICLIGGIVIWFW